MIVVYGPRGGVQPVEPVVAPAGNLYWMRVSFWGMYKGISEDVSEHLDRKGTETRRRLHDSLRPL